MLVVEDGCHVRHIGGKQRLYLQKTIYADLLLKLELMLCAGESILRCRVEVS